VGQHLFWENPKLSILTLKTLLVTWPTAYIALVYLPLRYLVAVGWVAFFIYMSEFGSRLVYALYRTVHTRVEDIKTATISSFQVADEEPAR